MSLQTEIRQHFRAEVRDQVEISWGEIEQRDARGFTPLVSGRGGPWVGPLLAMGTALIVLVLAVPVLLPASSDEGTSAPTDSVAELSLSTSTIEGAPSNDWVKVDGPPFAQSPNGLLTTDEEGFVYVGDDGVSRSIDGLTWETTQRPSSQAVAYRDGVIMSISGGGAYESDGGLVVIPSVITTTRPDGTESTLTIEKTVTRYAVAPQGYMVIATDAAIDEGEVEKPGGWFSSDGVAWNELTVDWPHSLALVGTSDGFYRLDFVGIWHSIDGERWNLVASELGYVEDEYQRRLTTFGNKAVWVRSDGYDLITPTGVIPGASWPEHPPRDTVVFGDRGVLSIQVFDDDANEPVTRAWYAAYDSPFVPISIPGEMVQDNVHGLVTAVAFEDRFLVMFVMNDFQKSFWIGDFRQ